MDIDFRDTPQTPSKELYPANSMLTASLLTARLSGALKARLEHWLSCGRLFFPACPSNVEAEAAAPLLLSHASVVASVTSYIDLALGKRCRLKQVRMLLAGAFGSLLCVLLGPATQPSQAVTQ